MQTMAIFSPAATALSAATEVGNSSGSKAPFGDVLKNAITNVDELQQQASASVDGLLRGSGVDIHQAAIAAQTANMAFELALSVRNHAVAAYQQVMGMQF